MELREATISDLELLRYWDEQPHVVESDPNDDWQWEYELLRKPTWREQLVAELDGRPIGFVQIIDPAKEESRYWGDIDTGFRAIDIWLGEPKDLGKGYGTTIMNMLIDRCFSINEVNAILVDPLQSNKKACNFYQKLGFQRIGERRFGMDDCFIYKLNRTNA